jgi:hypothetical protein
MKQSKIKFTSRCGLNCEKCSAYIATVTNDDELREVTTIEWNKKYNATGRLPVTKADINCLGCLSLINPIYKHCKECGVRKCALKKGIKNCGECINYKSCPKISSLHQRIPEGKKVCDIINKIIS